MAEVGEIAEGDGEGMGLWPTLCDEAHPFGAESLGSLAGFLTGEGEICRFRFTSAAAITVFSLLLCGHRVGQLSFTVVAPWTISSSWTRKLQGVLAAILLGGYAYDATTGQGDAHNLASASISLRWAGVVAVVYVEDCRRGAERAWQLKSLLFMLASESLVPVTQAVVGITSGSISDGAAITKRLDFALAILTILMGVLALVQRPDGGGAGAGAGAGVDGAGAAHKAGSYGRLKEDQGGTEMENLAGAPKLQGKPKSMHESKVDGQKSPEEQASWLEEWIFSWLTPVLVLGSKQDLEAKHLPNIRDIDSSEVVCSRLISAWIAQLSRPVPSLFWALHRVFGGAFWTCALHKIANDLLAFASPLILRKMLQLLEEDRGTSSSYADCIILALMLFAAKMCFSILWNQYFHRLFRIGWQVRSAVSGLVYRKVLKLGSRSMGEHPLGDIVSLVSLDSMRLGVAMGYLHYLWSSPFLIVIAVYLLFDLLGSPALAGLLLMFILTPANIKVAKAMEKLNAKLMKTKDRRASLLDETLQSIRMIKVFAWEQFFMDRVKAVRDEEIGLMRQEAKLYIFFSVMWTGSNVLVALVTFVAYSWSGKDLKPNVAFPALALFNLLRSPMAALPGTINMAIDCRTSLKRLINFLTADEVDPNYHANGRGQDEWTPDAGSARQTLASAAEPVIRISKGEFSWPQQRTLEERADAKKEVSGSSSAAWTLSDVEMEIAAGEHIFVAGPVGAGKSSLLLAILGGIDKSPSSVVELRGRVAYVPQQPWIFNASLRENILFGSAYDEELYSKVVQACALTSDFKVLPDGDETEIGEKGINLSGGQKARVSLARACYQDADVYLLDDPLAAVDVHVARHLMDQCVLGILKSKAVVLVTHQTQYLPLADSIVVIKEGAMAASGPLSSVSSQHPDLLDSLDKEPRTSEGATSETPVEQGESFDEDARPEHQNVPEGEAGVGQEGSAVKHKIGDTAKEATVGENSGKVTEGGGSASKVVLVQDEKMESGAVSMQVWVSLAKTVGSTPAMAIVTLFFLAQLMQTSSDTWLSIWSSAVVIHEETAESDAGDGGSGETTVDAFNTTFYLNVYIVITLSTVAAIAISSFSVVSNLLRASRNLHESMLYRIMHAPTKFFDATPMGRILNRFTGDMNEIDKELRKGLDASFQKGMKLLFVLLVVLYVTPPLIVIVGIMAVVYFYVQRFYRQTSRQISRIETVSKSHIITLLSETVSGQGSIRAFDAQHRFISKFNSRGDGYTLAYATSNTCNRWLQVRLEFIGNISVGFSALLAILGSKGGAGTAGLVGLSITYALDVTESLNWLIRNFIIVEKGMVSAERINEYSHDIENETTHVPDYIPPTGWPSLGVLEFKDVVMAYRVDLPPALRGVSFTTAPSEKLGVVGRTGAGKSSLAVAIWRMTEISQGRILLDGEDISKMGTCDLRQRLSIIPQDPVIFSGTVRSNVDPLEMYTDKEVWEALERVQFTSFLGGGEDGSGKDAGDRGLGMLIQSGGLNLSTGQRQLLCLARALVRSSKLILIDEATASVDMTTDALIQKSIKDCFGYATVLTIAHRIATVMECDRVLVMSDGKVAEIGVPTELKSDRTSLFHAMTSH